MLYALMALIFCLVAGIFIRYRFLEGANSPNTPMVPSATASLNRVDHTATKEGVKQWSLKAQTVNYYQDDNLAVFDVLTLILFSKDQPPTTLTSDTGRMDTETSEINATGHVLVVNGPYTLKTETLNYKDKEKIITAPVHVTVSNGNSVITADMMTMDMNTSISVFQGHVKGVFRDPQ